MPARNKKALARDTYIALMRSHDALSSEFTELFKQHGLTQAWFNVLRILRGAGDEGMPCQVVGSRLIQRVPDVTRLLDRMEREGLIVRERSSEDRRVVLARLTSEGRRRVDALDAPTLDLHGKQFAALDRASLEALEADLLRLAGRPLPA